MGTSEESDELVEQKYENLCLDLNMDPSAKQSAWDSFQRIRVNYTLEGNSLHWLCCALYVACRESATPTVGVGTVQGNGVSLTRLLRSAKLSLIEFFKKMHKWSDMANMPQEFRDRVDRLEKKFAVSTVIYKKFEPIFLEIFKNPADDPPKVPRSRKQRRLPCTPTDVFKFCWTLFAQVRGTFPAIGDDLVNSYHLLLCCVDTFYSNALMSSRRDLLNPDFAGLPENFKQKDFHPPEDVPCIMSLLISQHEGIPVEALGIKEHWWKPHIRKLFNKGELRGRGDNLTGLLDIGTFDYNTKSISARYDEYVLNGGDFDERVFLGEDADAEIGTPAKSPAPAPAVGGEIRQRLTKAHTLKQHFEETRSLAPSTPLTGRKYLKDKMAEAPVTPVSTATQSVSKLQALLAGRKAGPSAALTDIFKNCCSRNPEEEISQRVKEMGGVFCTKYASPSHDHPGSHIDFAKKRLQLGELLYYKVLENIMVAERKRIDTKASKADFSVLLEQDFFHKSLFACCLEIVIFSYNHQRVFPWISEVFELQPYYFYKVIEVLIRAEENLSREVIKHLNHIEEQILECYAWTWDSPLWVAIRATDGRAPSVEEVSLPSHMESSGTGGGGVAAGLQSPLMHPALRRIAAGAGGRVVDPGASPTGLSAADRFSSPMPGSSSVKRQLFRNGGVENSPGRGESGTVLETTPTTQRVLHFQQAQTEDGRQVLIPVQYIRSTAGADADSQSTSQPTGAAQKPKKTGSLALFFRKIYYLSSVRLRDLCERLNVTSELRQQIWTCFEHVLMNHLDLLMDRHLDQIIMCAIYVMCKVTQKDVSFQSIMREYRVQPQAHSHVYRSVLLTSRERPGSGGGADSGSNSPVDSDKKCAPASAAGTTAAMRSTSALPAPAPDSCPPTPTRLAGTGSQFEFEDRGDLIRFYNSIFVKRMKTFATKFSVTTNSQGSASSSSPPPPLSSLPAVRVLPPSPRRVSTHHSVYVSPHKARPVAAGLLTPSAGATPSMTPRSRLLYCFNRSPAQDLRAINNMIKINERNQISGKRLTLSDDSDHPAAKRIQLGAAGRRSPAALTKKLEGIMSDRSSAANGSAV